MVVRVVIFIQGRFLKQCEIWQILWESGLIDQRWERGWWLWLWERGNVAQRPNLRSLVEIGSKSAFGVFDRILWISDSETKGERRKIWKCDKRRKWIRWLCKKVAGKRQTKFYCWRKKRNYWQSDVAEREKDLRFNSLFTVCQRCLGLSDDEERRLE